MSTNPAVALAVPFVWTPGGTYDLRLAFASGTSPVDITADAGTYRMNLAKTSGSVRDFLRRLEARANAALAAASRVETLSVDITALGIVTIALSQGTATWTLTSTLAELLGLSATSFAAVAAVAGADLPEHFYLFAGGDSPGWSRREPIAGAMTAAGASYGVRSGLVTWTDEISLDLIPSTLADRAAMGEVWSPWESSSTSRPYGCERILTTALAQPCAFARFWQSTRASTTEVFDLVTIAPAVLSKPDVKYQFPSLTTWRQWRLPLVRTAEETRA